MKIKILSSANGSILSAVLPPAAGVQNLTMGGPVLKPGTKFDELELSELTRSEDLPRLLQQSRVVRSKKAVSLQAKKKKPKPARAVRKKSRAPAKK